MYPRYAVHICSACTGNRVGVNRVARHSTHGPGSEASCPAGPYSSRTPSTTVSCSSCIVTYLR